MRVRFLLPMLALLIAPLVAPAEADAHCQVPCGIYDDPLRALLIREHIGTMEKSMMQITALSGAGDPDMNQIVRWVENKEDHADQIVDIVTAYFLSQRVKLPADGDAKAQAAYQQQLALLHGLLVYTMKARQGTDLANIEKLRELSTAFEKAYFGHPVEVTAH